MTRGPDTIASDGMPGASSRAAEAEPVIYAPGHRSLMRDGGRVATLGAGLGTAFVLILSAKFQITAFLILCIAVLGLSAVMWALGTLELRLIEIRDALGGRSRDGGRPDGPSPRIRLVK